MKHVSNERTGENSRKRTKNGSKQSKRYRVRNTGYEDAQGTIENYIKETVSIK